MSNNSIEPISQVYNCDCVEYMKTLPDKAFDLAICDPPYGGANDTTINGGGRFGQWFDRYKSTTPLEGGSTDTMFSDRRHVGQQIRGGYNRLGYSA